MSTAGEGTFAEVMSGELWHASICQDWERCAQILAHMRAEGMTEDQIAEATAGMPVSASEYLREQRGRLVRQLWLEWARKQPNAKPSWLLPWEDLDEGQREVDRQIGEGIAKAEVGARGRVEPNLIYAAVTILYTARHRLPSDVLRSLAGIWMCASAAQFGAPHETWWWKEDDPLYSSHETAECEAEGIAYPDPEETEDYPLIEPAGGQVEVTRLYGTDWEPETGE